MNLSIGRSLVVVPVTMLAALLATGMCNAEVWGVKSHPPLSEPPSTLFRVSAFGAPLSVVGEVTLGGDSIDVDALAMDSTQILYGFELIPPGGSSRLITISTSNATAAAVGPELAGREIRGATITGDDRLLALDAASDELLEIDPQTGLIIGAGIGLTHEGEPYALSSFSDLVETGAGELILVAYNQFYALDEGTGELVTLYTDTTAAPDG